MFAESARYSPPWVPDFSFSRTAKHLKEERSPGEFRWMEVNLWLSLSGSRWAQSSGRSSKLPRSSVSALFSTPTSPLSSRPRSKSNTYLTHSPPHRSAYVLILDTAYMEGEIPSMRLENIVPCCTTSTSKTSTLAFWAKLGARSLTSRKPSAPECSLGLEADVSISTVSFDFWPKTAIQAGLSSNKT